MRHEGRGASIQSLTYIDIPADERCDCAPLSPLHTQTWQEQEEIEGSDQVIPATEELYAHLQAELHSYFPRQRPLSLFVLHISQLEHLHITPKTAIFYKRHRYHAPESFLNQVLTNVQRTIRYSDPILVHKGTGAAIILPDVDAEGASTILERIYYSVNLLQPETFIPPLKRETDILMGMGSYPKPGASLEELLYYTGLIARRLRLRPAVTAQLRSAISTNLAEEAMYRQQAEEQVLLHYPQKSGIPFMQLPSRLPQRLKQLISYELAVELRCAPVGRDHNRLTVAMAHPNDVYAIRRLHDETGMTIFPVSCEGSALEMLLANRW